jgi:hypothetical protein
MYELEAHESLRGSTDQLREHDRPEAREVVRRQATQQHAQAQVHLALHRGRGHAPEHLDELLEHERQLRQVVVPAAREEDRREPAERARLRRELRLPVREDVRRRRRAHLREHLAEHAPVRVRERAEDGQPPPAGLPARVEDARVVERVVHRPAPRLERAGHARQRLDQREDVLVHVQRPAHEVSPGP